MSIFELDSMSNTQRELFKNAVLKLHTQSESRNCSDTLDYSDFQTVTARYALVWLPALDASMKYYLRNDGPSLNGVKQIVAVLVNADYSFGDANGASASKLPAEQQFAWIDCSNHMAWRYGVTRAPEMDAFAAVTHFTAQMLEAYFVYDENQKKLAIDAEKAVMAAKSREDERLKKAAAEEQAEQALKHSLEIKLASGGFKKGVSVKTSKGSGKIAWTGITKYRGKWDARIGVRIAGNMQFFALNEVTK